MLRNFAAGLAGIVLAAAIYTLIRIVGDIVYVPPAGLDFSDAESVDRYHAQLPLGAYVFKFAKAVVAAFFGTMLAASIGTGASGYFGAVIGGIVLAYTISLFIAVPHPLWLVVATLLGIMLSTYVAVRIAPRSGDSATELFERDRDTG